VETLAHSRSRKLPHVFLFKLYKSLFQFSVLCEKTFGVLGEHCRRLEVLKDEWFYKATQNFT
jgi:hypothetical protein